MSVPGGSPVSLGISYLCLWYAATRPHCQASLGVSLLVAVDLSLDAILGEFSQDLGDGEAFSRRSVSAAVLVESRHWVYGKGL